jgi:hypothetical protein
MRLHSHFFRHSLISFHSISQLVVLPRILFEHEYSAESEGIGSRCYEAGTL